MTAASARITLTLTAWLLVTPPVLVVMVNPIATAQETKGSTDPSALTTQALQREIAALKEIIITRMDEAAKAIILLQQRVDREPQISVVHAQLNALRELLTERFEGVEIQFKGIDKQFSERDVRGDLSSKATETAINAALSAQKESVTAANASFAEATRKAEASTKERLDQLTTLFQTETRSLAAQLAAITKTNDDKLATITARLGLIEGSGVGQQRAQERVESGTTLIIGIVGALVAIIGIGLAIILALRRPSPVVQGNGNR